MGRYAAIDMGSNSTRLLIAEFDNGSGTTLDRQMRITRLGAGVDESRRLAPDAIDRTVDCLRYYRSIIDSVGGVDAIRATAT